MNVSAKRITLGKDPEFAYTKNGNPFVKFTAAENFYRKNDEGEWETTKTQWYNCQAFGLVAEDISLLSKGTSIELIEGRLDIDQYVDKQGAERTGYKVMVNKFAVIEKQPRQDD